MNLPNRLTLMRMILIPFVIFFYLATFIPFGIGKIVALVLFIVASITDLLDGKIARKRNIVTNFGKFLDPIADKLLTSSVLLMLIADRTIPHPWGVIAVIIIIGREFIVTGLRLLCANNGKVLAADMWGKSKTMVQMIAIPLCILLAFFLTPGFNLAVGFITFMKVLCYVLIGVATLLTIISGTNYLVKNRGVFKEIQ